MIITKIRYSARTDAEKGELVEYIGKPPVPCVDYFFRRNSGKSGSASSFPMETGNPNCCQRIGSGIGNTGNQQVEENAAGDAAAEETPARTYMVQSGIPSGVWQKAYYGSGAKFPVIFLKQTEISFLTQMLSRWGRCWSFHRRA